MKRAVRERLAQCNAGQPPRRPRRFYGLLRVEQLGRKHPGLVSFVVRELRGRTAYRAALKIVPDMMERWGEHISAQAVVNFFVQRVWPHQAQKS